jgi:hypothetical protein
MVRRSPLCRRRRLVRFVVCAHTTKPNNNNTNLRTPTRNPGAALCRDASLDASVRACARTALAIMDGQFERVLTQTEGKEDDLLAPFRAAVAAAAKTTAAAAAAASTSAKKNDAAAANTRAMSASFKLCHAAIARQVRERVTKAAPGVTRDTVALHCMLFGVAALNMFVQANWTGPSLPASPLLPAEAKRAELKQKAATLEEQAAAAAPSLQVDDTTFSVNDSFVGGIDDVDDDKNATTPATTTATTTTTTATKAEAKDATEETAETKTATPTVPKPRAPLLLVDHVNRVARLALNAGGEDFSRVSRFPYMLQLARAILLCTTTEQKDDEEEKDQKEITAKHPLRDVFSWSMWAFRCTAVHQPLLAHSVPVCRDLATSIAALM